MDKSQVAENRKIATDFEGEVVPVLRRWAKWRLPRDLWDECLTVGWLLWRRYGAKHPAGAIASWAVRYTRTGNAPPGLAGKKGGHRLPWRRAATNQSFDDLEAPGPSPERRAEVRELFSLWVDTLTQRERTVLWRIEEGDRRDEIARSLRLNRRWVSNLVCKMRRKWLNLVSGIDYEGDQRGVDVQGKEV